MKILRYLLILAFCASFTSRVVSSAQNVDKELSTPASATAIAGGPTKLRIGQSFDFTLRFGRAPDGYQGGGIQCVFQRERSPDDFPQSAVPELIRAGSPLHDGQAIYLMSLPIDASMRPGTWKLIGVTLGEAVQKPIPITEEASFEVLAPEPDLAIHLVAPSSIRAGRKLAVRIVVDKYPPTLDPNCTFAFSLFMFNNGPTAYLCSTMAPPEGLSDLT